MRAIAALGIVFIVVGIVALAYGGFAYRVEEKQVQVGPIEVRAQEKKIFPISPLAGGVLVAGGIVLLILGSRR